MNLGYQREKTKGTQSEELCDKATEPGIGGFVRASRETSSLERTIREKLQQQKSDNLNKLHKLDSAIDALNNNETIQKVFEILSLADLA